MRVFARIPLTVEHHFDFSGALPGRSWLDAAAWDALRAGDSAFGFSKQEPDLMLLRARAAAVCAIVGRVAPEKKVCSYGIGTGVLERLLAENVELTCTEYAPSTLDRLRQSFPGVVAHDLRDGPLPGFGFHLLHRVDTELSDREWRCYFAAVEQPHLMILSAFLTAKAWRIERATRRRRGVVRAGWLRTEKRWRQLLPSGAERVECGDLIGFLFSHR